MEKKAIGFDIRVDESDTPTELAQNIVTAYSQLLRLKEMKLGSGTITQDVSIDGNTLSVTWTAF